MSGTPREADEPLRLARARASAFFRRGARRSHWFVVGTVCVGALMAMVDASIVNVAMPTFERAFASTVADVEWIAIAYLLTLTMLLTIFGRVADLFGRSRMYNLGFVVFIVGSAACAMSPSLGVLIISRILQAAGAAMLQTNSVALITAVSPTRALGASIGVQGAAQAVGLAIGPAVGGVLLVAFGWQAIFWVNVPFGIVGTLLALCFLPRDERRKGSVSFDALGGVLVALATFAGMLALSEGIDWGWTSWPTVLAVGICVASSYGFIEWELRRRQPLVDPRLFQQRPFAVGNATGLLSFIVFQGALFLTPFYLTRVGGMDTQQAGLTLTAVPATLGLIAPFAGRISDRVGARLLTSGGMGLASISVAGLGLGMGGRGGTTVVAWLALLGLGMGLFTSPNNASIMSTVARHRLSSASGILNMTRSLGMSAGVALAGTLYAAGVAGGPASGEGEQLAALRTAFLAIAAVGIVAAALSVVRGGTLRSVPALADSEFDAAP